MPYVGLYVSDEAIRFVELIRNRKDFKLGRYGEKILYPGIVQSGYINDVNALTKSLKELKKEFNLYFVSVALPEEKAYLFKMDVPNIDEKEIRTNIEFHLAENVPISPDQTIFDYEATGDNKIIVSALPSKVVNTYLDVFVEAGLCPVGFKTEGQALVKAFIKKEDLGTYIIINAEEKKTGIFIVSEGVVRFSSTIIGDESVVKNEVDKVRNYWDTHDEKNKKIEKVIIPSSPWVNAFNLDKYIPPIESSRALKYAVPIGLTLD
ncbi:MAG: pilus assembly protein PilM [Patescibacteria group bacterium]|nr:pilus assembly protein PilM [Patescibacteria group bacterium]